MKGYKVTDSGRMRMFGVACDTLSQLRSKGVTRLGIEDEVYLALDDGTILDDEDYFQLVPPQTVIIFYRKTEPVVTGADYILNLLKRVNAEYLTAGEKANAFLSEKTQELLKLLQEKEKVEERSNTRQGDPDWFANLETNATTKEEHMFRKSQDRIKGYLYKFQGDARKSPAYLDNATARKDLNECIAFFKNKLQEDEYFGCFFDRRCAKAKSRDEVDIPRVRHCKEERSAKRWKGEEDVTEDKDDAVLPTYDKVSYCDGEGKFVCQGKWDSAECTFGYGHVINPYLDRESRILFSTWNLDHRIEKSRTILPTLFNAVLNRRNGESVNYEYFYKLLFTNFNLKLVHVVCHDKTMHNAFCDAKHVYKR